MAGPTWKNKQLPTISDAKAFERLCVDMWRRMLRNPSVQKYGRDGQAQHGVDLIGLRPGTRDWVGVQCKVRTGGRLIPSDIDSDINAACELNPRLSELVVATTARRDTSIQDYARKKTAEHQEEGVFSVSCFFWDDVEHFLLDDANLDLLHKHFREFVIEVLPAGVSLGKTLTLRVGVGSHIDTQYELVIGKTCAPTDPDSYLGLDYFKGLSYMVNANDHTVAFFRLPCRHPDDIARAIRYSLDRLAITKWLNTFGSIEELLDMQEECFTATISVEERRAHDQVGSEED